MSRLTQWWLALAIAGLLVGLAVVAAVVWWPWGLAVADGIALTGGVFVWVLVVMPRRVAPPVPDDETLNDARTRLRNDLRSGPLQLLTALLTVLAVLVGAWLGFQQLTEDRDQAIQDRQLTRQGQASERFTRAIDQLGNDRVETRIGGIYGLHQIAEQSSEENTGPIGEVLLAWLNGRPRPRTPPETQLREHAPDVQAALSVLTGRRYALLVANRLDLHGLGLHGAYLYGADLEGASLNRAKLNRANLNGANLHGADLGGADLLSANLIEANLFSASLIEANLHDADLSGANLTDASLGGAGLFLADLGDAGLGGANLRGADLRLANLSGANLRGADLRDTDLKGATADTRTRWPDGFDWRRAGAALAP